MATVAFIPARGGSKGIPKKNIRMLAGKPLIAWSIEQAKRSTLIDKVVVSTDCPEIAECALRFGAEVPFLRPSDISGDTASTESAMLHYCDWLVSHDEKFDNFLLIQATSPVRADGRFDDAIRFFKEGQFNSLLTVSPSHRFFWKNPASPQASYDFMSRPRRQDILESERNYLETGSFYITRLDDLIKTRNRLCGRIGMYITPEDESYEIDSLMDFNICECIMLGREAK
ncbi:cytidylyltransferase domain-containing protein [Pseudomonas sp. YQ_5]|uniref:acylneuraminate cytidylyltransferase family protein n=1 Tax=unclassified Pseudomonas TaxID=196821 RepID=UPI00244A35B5|nr:acylneuraminate cytidylyltransferase family protein [Pseudomonas sp. GD03696]MDH1933107.1 acylneuraminate cytidylyltransferase family protein [Pseudomonas sp. GD03696]HDS0930928.1 acylneuraminate cytidylyltransferase family protein [Pseudomonas putida]